MEQIQVTDTQTATPVVAETVVSTPVETTTEATPAAVETTNTDENFDADSFMNHGKPVSTEQSSVEQSSTDTIVNKNDLEIDTPLKHVWQFLSEDLSDEANKYALPEVLKTKKNIDGSDLTPKQEWDLIRQEVLKNTDFGLDDFAIEYLKAKDTEGFDRTSFLESKFKEQTMTDEDRIFMSMRTQYDPNEISDDILKEEISAMPESRKKLLSVDLKKQEKEINEKIIAQKEQKRITDLSKEVLEANKQTTEIVNTLVENIKSKKKIAGIEMGDAEIENFSKQLPGLFEQKLYRDDNNNIVKKSQMDFILEENLSNPESALDIAYFLMAKKNGTLEQYTQSIKDKVKDDVQSKLSPTPEINSGSSSNNKDFDSNAFMKGR